MTATAVPAIDMVIQELEQEAIATRRQLEAVPGEKLDWRPHPKSMSLGQLAHHIATAPGSICQIAEADELDYDAMDKTPAVPESKQQILAAFEESLVKAKVILGRYDAAKAAAPWRLIRKGHTVMELPRTALLRMILLNHWYHHRGQLQVYLRLLDVSVPSIYGPTADEDPFAAA